jgi:hypothetical protein
MSTTMNLINGKIRLIELAKLLGLESATIRQHLYKNHGGIAEDHEKLGDRLTGDHLLSIDSTLTFLGWLKAKGRKVNLEQIEFLENEINSIRNN